MRVTFPLKLSLIARVAGALCLLSAATIAVAGFASAQSTSGVTVSPNPVQTAAVFAQTNGQYQGDAGVLTVTVGPNTVFTAGTPLRFEECDLDPTAQTSCDGLTLQSEDVGKTTSVVPSADGSVTFTMDLWELPTGNTPDSYDPTNDNPGGFDPGSTVNCYDAVSDPSTTPNPGTAQPCSIWVGDDPSHWTENSFVVNGIQPLAAPGKLPTTTTTTTTSTTTTTTGTGSTSTTTRPTSTTTTTTGTGPTSTTTRPTSTTTTTTTTTVASSTTTTPSTTSTSSITSANGVTVSPNPVQTAAAFASPPTPCYSGARPSGLKSAASTPRHRPLVMG